MGHNAIRTPGSDTSTPGGSGRRNAQRAERRESATIGHMEQRDWRNRIVCDPAIRHGEPVVRGTRIAVSVLVASLTHLTIDELLKQYPQLTRADIDAAILYAAEAAHNTLVA